MMQGLGLHLAMQQQPEKVAGPLFLGRPQMLNAIPVFGWFISLCINTSLAIPFWYFWNVQEVGRKYFNFLPKNWQSIPFFDCIALFISVSIIQTVFVPKFVNVNQNVEKKD